MLPLLKATKEDVENHAPQHTEGTQLIKGGWFILNCIINISAAMENTTAPATLANPL